MSESMAVRLARARSTLATLEVEAARAELEALEAEATVSSAATLTPLEMAPVVAAAAASSEDNIDALLAVMDTDLRDGAAAAAASSSARAAKKPRAKSVAAAAASSAPLTPSAIQAHSMTTLASVSGVSAAKRRAMREAWCPSTTTNATTYESVPTAPDDVTLGEWGLIWMPVRAIFPNHPSPSINMVVNFQIDASIGQQFMQFSDELMARVASLTTLVADGVLKYVTQAVAYYWGYGTTENRCVKLSEVKRSEDVGGSGYLVVQLPNPWKSIMTNIEKMVFYKGTLRTERDTRLWRYAIEVRQSGNPPEEVRYDVPEEAAPVDKRARLDAEATDASTTSDANGQIQPTSTERRETAALIARMKRVVLEHV